MQLPTRTGWIGLPVSSTGVYWASPPPSGTVAVLLASATTAPAASGPGAWSLPSCGSTTAEELPSEVTRVPEAASKTTPVSPTAEICGSARPESPSISVEEISRKPAGSVFAPPASSSGSPASSSGSAASPSPTASVRLSWSACSRSSSSVSGRKPLIRLASRSATHTVSSRPTAESTRPSASYRGSAVSEDMAPRFSVVAA